MSRSIVIEVEVAEILEKLILGTSWGSLTVVVQDGCIVQLERNEKFQFGQKRNFSHLKEISDSGGCRGSVLRQIQTALIGIQFGQLMLKIQEGRIVQIDRTEKQRMIEWTGTSGDGL